MKHDHPTISFDCKGSVTNLLFSFTLTSQIEIMSKADIDTY